MTVFEWPLNLYILESLAHRDAKPLPNTGVPHVEFLADGSTAVTVTIMTFLFTKRSLLLLDLDDKVHLCFAYLVNKPVLTPFAAWQTHINPSPSLVDLEIYSQSVGSTSGSTLASDVAVYSQSPLRIRTRLLPIAAENCVFRSGSLAPT